ncbi:permease-like cell division protein FtsX [Acidimicrobiaceae bacterium]|jgi:cell division transport system permease protein|nr:permease-like cell division protein FtsX [Acidimicrobiaceae bacterium]
MNFRIGNLFRELSYSLRRSFSLFVGTLLTILISMTVLGAGLVLSAAVETATDRWKDGVEFIVFLNPDASEAEKSSVTNKLNSSPEIDRFTFVDKEAAFVEFQSMFRDSDQIRESVAIADMPPSFRIVPESPESDVVETLADGFRDDPGVFEVVAAVDTIKDIETGSTRINRIFLIVGMALLVSALLLVYNTIRTTIFARRREVEVMRLVGASNWYIRVPFMIEGTLQGLLGGALTLPILQLWNNVLSDIGSGDGLALLADLRAPDQTVIMIWLAMTALGAVIGMVASVVALSRFLDV